MSDDAARDHNTTRRIFLHKMAYIPPTILTMSALASVASAASGGAPRQPTPDFGPNKLGMGNMVWGW